MEKLMKDHPNIKGWGEDMDPKNDPTYPMKPNRTDEEQLGYSWERPAQQQKTVEVLMSTERPTITSVFGTSTPPKGLSGAIRRFAFKYSEGSFGHWLPLIFADRINVIEGIIDDVKQGRFPNIWAEKGLKARWQYDKQTLIQNVVAGVLLSSAAAYFLFRKKETALP